MAWRCWGNLPPPRSAPAANKTAGQPRERGLVEVVRDEAGDPSYLKIPMPKPELVSQALQALKVLSEGMR